MATRETVHELVREFWRAPDEALFSQRVIAAVRGCSESTLERDRQVGNGIAFLKIGRQVRYRKQDVTAWLASFPTRKSTSAYAITLRTQAGSQPRLARGRGGRQ